MADKNMLTIWKKFSAIIADEISTNTDFARKMSAVLGEDVSDLAPKKTIRRSPAKINPFTLLSQGEHKLTEALVELNIDELKDIISEYRMDTAKRAAKWKRDRLETLIVDVAKQEFVRGNAFWNTNIGKTDST